MINHRTACLEAELSELEAETKMLVRILGCKKRCDHSAVYQRFLDCNDRAESVEQQLMALGRVL